MISSARQAIACVLFIFIAAVVSCSQITPAKTASVSGKITLKNKPLAGIVVAARSANYSAGRYRATTDQSGMYQITNLPPGTYEVTPVVAGLIVEDELRQKSLVIDEGDVIEEINFSMLRGGVITGKITDADGQPLVEEQVFIHRSDGPSAQTVYYRSGTMTDDRGVYRAFGLRAGKYKVSVGQSDYRLTGGPRAFRETFYPSVTDAAKASEIEVAEGSESTNIDIVMGRPVTAFKVTGRIVDGETGKPLPNIRYGVHRSTDNGGGQSMSGASSNANGEFRFDGVMPGKYSAFINPEQDLNVRAEWISFEVIDHDVSGLVIKTIKASSVSGVVVLEGSEDPSAIAKIGNLYVHAMVPVVNSQFSGTPGAAVSPAGNFRISGLPPGVATFAFGMRSADVRKQVSLVRVERDGIPQPSGVTIKEGEQITGLRLVVKTMTGSIRGQVKTEDGELPQTSRMSIWLNLLDENRPQFSVNGMNSNPQLDSRGRFLIEGLAAGTYEINIALFEPGRSDTTRIFKQQVTVTDNAVSEVTVTVKLTP